jgi:phospholipase C
MFDFAVNGEIVHGSSRIRFPLVLAAFRKCLAAEPEWLRREQNPSTVVPGKPQHIVVIFQENRTPDNLFHDPVLMAKGADIANNGINSAGQTIPLMPTSLGVDYDLDHSHKAFLAMYNGGKMDGADKVHVSCGKGASNCPPPNAQFQCVQASDAGPYFQLAEQYTFGDRMFQTNQGLSFPAHQFIISGTSAPTATSNLIIAENAGGVANAGGDTGCTSPRLNLFT